MDFYAKLVRSRRPPRRPQALACSPRSPRFTARLSPSSPLGPVPLSLRFAARLALVLDPRRSALCVCVYPCVLPPPRSLTPIIATTISANTWPPPPGLRFKRLAPTAPPAPRSVNLALLRSRPAVAFLSVGARHFFCFPAVGMFP